MTSNLRLLTAASAAALLLTLAACTTAAPSVNDNNTVGAVSSACADSEGVTLSVDASALGDEDDVSGAWCVLTDEGVGAADALSIAAITTEGTEEYGDQVVCRVNNVPAADLALTAEDGSDYFEQCESMPAAFAYWSLWVKPVGGEWDYAQEGIATLQLEPGDAAELLFTLNGEPATPSS
ncbi:hypothetical protein LG299_07145 [Microbacterium lacus]|uniref:hypothetical protein n=1 Tax=Microbacterium lacus TaxID=415217 RepID=UPI0038508DA7